MKRYWREIFCPVSMRSVEDQLNLLHRPWIPTISYGKNILWKPCSLLGGHELHTPSLYHCSPCLFTPGRGLLVYLNVCQTYIDKFDCYFAWSDRGLHIVRFCVLHYKETLVNKILLATIQLGLLCFARQTVWRGPGKLCLHVTADMCKHMKQIPPTRVIRAINILIMHNAAHMCHLNKAD